MKQKNLILMVVAVGCGLVAAFLTTQINAKPKVDQIEVWVAAKDLPVGTMLSKTELPKLIVKKTLPKDSLPQAFVVDENELVDKRLSVAVPADRTFDPANLSKGGVIILPEGKDMVSLQMGVSNSAAGFVGPGSKVDVLATLSRGTTMKAFPLLVDMLVLAVDTHTDYAKTGTFPNMSMVSFAVTQEQALLLALAKQRGCHMELLLRHPNKPLDPKYDIKAMKKLLEDEVGKTQFVTTAPDGLPRDVETRPNTDTTPIPAVTPGTPGTSEAPPPTPKAEMVKVLIAIEEIPAKTEITKDLIAQKFKELEIPKQLGEGAFADLTPCLGEFLKHGLGKNQWVTPAMVGKQETKPTPIDEFAVPKPDLKPTKPDPVKPPTVARQTHDVAVHTASGTLIYRYEEIKPGEWKFRQAMSPEEAAQPPKQSAAPQSPPATPEKSPDTGARKID